jgi:hypothetical protein
MRQLLLYHLRVVKGRLRLTLRYLLQKSSSDARLEVLSELFTHHTQHHSSSTSRRSPADVLFDRGSLCYGRPAYIPHTDVIATGLPPKRSCASMRKYMVSYFHIDVLNALNSSFRRSTRASWQMRDHHKKMEGARHLSKYTFPREYGLATVFSGAKAHKYSDFADREDEIKVRVEYVLAHLQGLRCTLKKARPSKTPKRVRSALDLLEKLIGRHGRCSYGTLRGITCPSKVKRPEQEAALDSSVILVCPLYGSDLRCLYNCHPGAHVRRIYMHIFSASLTAHNRSTAGRRFQG